MQPSARGFVSAFALSSLSAVHAAVADITQKTEPIAENGFVGKNMVAVRSNHWHEEKSTGVALLTPKAKDYAIDMHLPSIKAGEEARNISVPCKVLLNNTPLLSDSFSRHVWAYYPKEDVVQTAHLRLNAVLTTRRAFDIGQQFCAAMPKPAQTEPKMPHGFMKLPYHIPQKRNAPILNVTFDF